MSEYSAGRRAKGICDRCGFTYKLNKLNSEYVLGEQTGLLVCRHCLDYSHPQLEQGRYPVHDPEGLRDPRPDSHDIAATRGWVQPVRGLFTKGSVGQVRINP